PLPGVFQGCPAGAPGGRHPRRRRAPRRRRSRRRARRPPPFASRCGSSRRLILSPSNCAVPAKLYCERGRARARPADLDRRISAVTEKLPKTDLEIFDLLMFYQFSEKPDIPELEQRPYAHAAASLVVANALRAVVATPPYDPYRTEWVE